MGRKRDTHRICIKAGNIAGCIPVSPVRSEHRDILIPVALAVFPTRNESTMVLGYTHLCDAFYTPKGISSAADYEGEFGVKV